MCNTCGCGNTDGVVLHRPGESQAVHQHEHGDHHHETHSKNMIEIQTDVLEANDHIAAHNREHLGGKNILALNLMSSPGSGKTTLLEQTIKALANRYSWSVVEGDQQTTIDADRIHATGATSIQVNTGTGCHLDAQMLHSALHELNPQPDSIVAIENVGNLVCPALFDLGENYRVIIVSTTEGTDKPLKYPTIVERADICIINKVDLLPYVDFDLQQFKKNALSVNPHLQFLALSAKSGEGMPDWLDWIATQHAGIHDQVSQ
jgi:hydrogenase nickel incorporation protein HypB